LITQGFFGPRRGRAFAALFAALLGGVVMLVALSGRPSTSRSSPPFPAPLTAHTLAQLRTRADAGDPFELKQLLDTMTQIRDTNAARAIVADMLRSARAEVRAAACGWIGDHPHDALAPLLVPRLSDADWRVRAAAFDAVRHVAARAPRAPTAPDPLRDTPVDQRESLIFAWLDSWRSGAAVGTAPPLPDQCELYAPDSHHWLSGLALARSCTSCHAPPGAPLEVEFESCVSCHAKTHDEWSRSAHARSMTHLNLARVNDKTKQVERFMPDQHEGLVCTSCHTPAKSSAAATASVPPGTEELPIPHRFEPGAAAASCATCHAETQGEFEAWRRAPRPSASRWLPGEVTWDESPDARTCVSCHMQLRAVAGTGAAGGLVHAFASRRDPPFMRAGLSAHLEPPTSGRGAQLVLTNLAGHRYPSGTIRRALRVQFRYDIDTDTTRRLLTRLTDSTVPTTQPTQPALKPAEQRRLELPLVEGASRITCEITFERDQFEPGGYELPLHTLSRSIQR
jgi:hypothetical protein